MPDTASAPPTGRLSMKPTPLFFFGTLTDADLLRAVLGRRIEPGELESATLTGFRRVAVAGAPYPALLPRSGATVPGVLFRPRGRRELARIAFFEAGYRLRRCRAIAADGHPVFCTHWRIGPDTRLSTREWSPALWRRRDKTGFLRAARTFMRRFAHRRRR